MVPMLESYVKKILASQVYEVAQETPLAPAPLMSSRLGCEVWLKREDLQSIFSFKIRGSYNRIAALSAEEAQRGEHFGDVGDQVLDIPRAQLLHRCTGWSNRREPLVSSNATSKRLPRKWRLRLGGAT